MDGSGFFSFFRSEPQVTDIDHQKMHIVELYMPNSLTKNDKNLLTSTNYQIVVSSGN